MRAFLAEEPVREDPPDVRLTVMVKMAWNDLAVYQLRGISRGRTAIFQNGVCLGPGGKARLFRLIERRTTTAIAPPE